MALLVISCRNTHFGRFGMVRSVQLIAVHSKAGGGMDLQSVSTLSLATWAPFAECINSVGLTVLAIREDEAEGKRETQEARGAVVNVGGCVYYFELLDASLQGDSDGHLSVAPPLLVGSGVECVWVPHAPQAGDGLPEAMFLNTRNSTMMVCRACPLWFGALR